MVGRVDNSIADARIAICRACEFRHENESEIWCGTPIVGNEVVHEGQTKRTCGCKMTVKTKIKFLGCPIGKWHPTISVSEELKNEFRAFVHSVNPFRLTTNERQRINEIKNILSDTNTHQIGCSSCDTDTLASIKNALKLDDVNN